MTTADPIKRARERLAKTQHAADVITRMFMAAAPGQIAEALLEGIVSMRADIRVQQDAIERMEKREKEA